jgi:uncharacterized protein (UPF0332 family)
MNPHEFLDLAGELATGMSEAEWRSAVSRAYYSAFHTARLLLKRLGFEVPTADRAHAYLWLRLANSGHTIVQRAGNELRDLRRKRNDADYDLERPIDELLAGENVSLATDVVRVLEQLPSSPASTRQVTDAIIAYERDVLQDVSYRGP